MREDSTVATTAPPQTDLPMSFKDRLALLLVRTGDEVAARGDAALREVGLSGRTYVALAVIDGDAPSSQLELARLMGKAPALCVAMLDDLERSGLVARVRDPKDRRRSIVSLTVAGHEALERADAIARDIEAGTLDGLTADERNQLTGLLRKAVTRWTKVHVD